MRDETVSKIEPQHQWMHVRKSLWEKVGVITAVGRHYFICEIDSHEEKLFPRSGDWIVTLQEPIRFERWKPSEQLDCIYTKAGFREKLGVILDNLQRQILEIAASIKKDLP